MSASELYLSNDAIHPIDIAETIAEYRDWDFDRMGDDQIAMTLEGQWRSYSMTLAWAHRDEVLRLICTFDMEPPEDRLPALYDTLNRANDMVWSGTLTYWAEHKLMVWRYGLVLGDDQIATVEQVDRMIQSALRECERFYPALQLVSWGEQTPEQALNMALAEAIGRA